MQANQHSVQVNSANFQSVVVQRSRDLPVVVLCWAQQIPESVETKQTLELLVHQYQGKFLVAHMNVAEDPRVAQQLQIQGVPSIRLVSNGTIAAQLDGPQTESSLRQWIEHSIGPSKEAVTSDLKDLIASKNWRAALDSVNQSLQEDPKNSKLLIEQADILVCMGEHEKAQQAIAAIPESVPERIRPQNRLEIAEEAGGMRSLEVLTDALRTDPTDLDALYESAIQYANMLEYEPALQSLMKIIQLDRSYRGDIGRTSMILVMSLMGRDSDLAQTYRRKMFSLMH